MAKLFEGWTFSLPLPNPLKMIAEEKGTITTRSDWCSVYNDKKRAKKSTLHGPTLRAMECMQEILRGENGACGLQTGKKGEVLNYLLEYGSREERTALLYNPANGTIKGKSMLADMDGESLEETGKRSIKMILLMFVYASLEKEGSCYDEEFARYYSVYFDRKAAADDSLLQAAFICCDNIYRRLVGKKLPCNRRILDEQAIEVLETEQMESGFYAADVVRCGVFHIFRRNVSGNTDRCYSVLKAEQTYRQELELTEEERRRIPDIPEDFIVSEHAEDILRKVTRTGMRTFMIRGEAGGGKTTDVKIVAKCLGYPYYSLCCSEGTEETDLVSSYVPNTKKAGADNRINITWNDFAMDPAGALYGLTGTYEEKITIENAFEKLLEEAFRQGEKKAEERKDFVMVESELVQGCRRPSVVEIQEPASIGRAGTLIKLNSLLDDCACVTLADGEVVYRHPDTIIILTTNAGYKGCRPMDQSVLSRMGKILDTEPLTVQGMVERVMVKTGCSNKELLTQMAEQMKLLQDHYGDVIAMGGVCGYREYEDWVTGWMESGDMMKEIRGAVVSKMTDQRQIQDEIMGSVRLMAEISDSAV